MRHEGSIECKITGHRKFRIGLEVPCMYTLSGKQKYIKRLIKLLTKADSDKQGQTLSYLAIEILNLEQNFHYSYHICSIE